MNKKSCLNCGHRISDEFCSHCGQRSDTTRITPGSVIKSDILGLVWPIETKFPRIPDPVLLSPERRATDCISGKKMSYSYAFSFLLILFLFLFNGVLLHFYLNINSVDFHKEGLYIIDFFSEYSEVSLVGLILVLALIAQTLFKRMESYYYLF